MAEIATIARPYAEAAFRLAEASDGGLTQWSAALSRLAQVVDAVEVKNLIGNPRVTAKQLTELLVSLAGDANAQVQKFVSTTRHVYQPLILLFSKKVWDQLSPDERKILVDAAAETQPYNRRLSREADAKSLETLRTKGLTVTEFPAPSVAQLRERLKPVVEKYSREAGESLVREMLSEIDKVRTRK